MVCVIEMTFLCTAWHSFVLLRPKNRVKLLTQSAENRICMGKWAFWIWAHLFLKDEKARDNRTFYAQCKRSKIHPSKPPRMDLKSGPCHKNGPLYGARRSFVLLRQKKVKLLTQRVENQICMRKWAFGILTIYILRDEKAPDNRTFLTWCGR